MRPPVFVLGCARSGTTLLYHMLLSAGGFAVFRAESHVYDSIAPRFGKLRSAGSRRRAIDRWLQSRHFSISGLDSQVLRQRVTDQAHGPGDFLRVIMESMAEQQGADRWAECTPDHLLYLPEIHRDLPDALVLHIVRDGRDVALSLDRQAWIDPIPGDSLPRLLVTAMYWSWIVEKGRGDGRRLGPNYLEVHFEDVVGNPGPTLERIGRFIGQPLDYDRIREVGIGSVRAPNTSFRGEAEGFNPVDRWRRVPPAELARLEAALSPALADFGYLPAADPSAPPTVADVQRRRAVYRALFESKLWLKKRTPMGRLMTGLESLDA